MKKVVCIFIALLCLLTKALAQTISVEKPTITHPQEKYKAVEASSMLHAIEGSTAVYKIRVTGYDSIASVTSLKYNTTDVTSSCQLDKGVLTIPDITIDNLKANETQDFKITLIVREKGKETDTERSADAMSVKVYPAPSGKEVEKPLYLTFYKDTEEDLSWKFKGTGGNGWNCNWSIDNVNKTDAIYTLARIRGAKNTTLKLTATNIAPDGSTEWDKYEESWQIIVIPEAVVQPIVANNTSEELFQDQEWPLSVTTTGGNSSGWEYSWFVDDIKTSTTGYSYTLSIGEDERTTEQISHNVKLTVKNNLPTGTKPTSEPLEWTYYYNALFYPCPEVRFAENYPQNICDGDRITFGFVILDGQGTSLRDNPDYQWNYSWEGKNQDTYEFIGNNNTNSNGDLHSIKCEISGKLKGIDKPYKKILQHNVYVWPKPTVQPLTESESNYVSCGGRTVSVSIRTFGGQKDGWKFYYGKKGETETFSEENTFLFPISREAQRSTSPATEEYTMRAVNSVEGTVRCDTTLSFSVDVYPAPWIPNDIVIKDKNRQNASVKNGIREGNEVILSCEECYGGYPNAWNYNWSKNDSSIGKVHEIATHINNVYSGDTKSDSQTITFKCDVNNEYDGEQWASQEYKKQLIIYHRPSTPTSLTKKGNGTSGTMIATTSVSDADLEGHDYYLVFGYMDSNGQMHDAASQRQQAPGEVRWSTQISTSEMNNSSNTLYVYALWKYNNGVEITSGLRYIGSVDEEWDGSSYSGLTRAIIADATAIDAISYDSDKTTPQEYYSTNGVRSSRPSKGLNIVKMRDGSVKKIMVK